MKRQLDTSSIPEQFESYKRLKVNPDLLISIYFNVGPFPRVAVNLTRSSSVKELKQALQYRTGLTLDGYVLKLNGHTLKDKEPVESLAEQTIDVVQADASEIYHLDWETEPESEHEESSFAPSDHSVDSLHYPQPQTVNIADELARCQGKIDPQFVEVLFYNREDTNFRQWILANIHALVDAFAILQDVYAVDHLSEIISDALKSPILKEQDLVLQRWINALYMELEVLREYKSPCTFKLIKYFAVLASFTASQTWISQPLMDMSIQAIFRAAKSDIILDNGSMINLIKDMRERLSAEQLHDWREKWVAETYHFLHTSDWRVRTQSHQLSWIDFVLFADVALAPIESEKYYHWLVDAPYSTHAHFIPSIQFGMQIMKLLMDNKNKRTTWIRILSIILEFYSQYQYLSQNQIQQGVQENIAKFISIMQENQIEIYGNKKLSSDIMDTIIRKQPRSLENTEMNSIELLTSLSADVIQFLETKSSKLTSLHIRMPQYSVCCASTSRLSKFNHLQKLSLCMPSLSNIDFTSIVTQMGPQLTQLDLQGAEELRKCFSVISHCKKMKKLNLAQTSVTYSELLDITDSCQDLEELNIADCWALNEDRLVLAELFQDGLQQLRVLDASGLQVQKDFQFMANQGYYLPNVRELTVNNTLVDPHHILRVFPNLEVLNSAHGSDMKDTVVTEATFDYNSTNSLKSVNIASKGFSNFCKYLDCLSFSYGLEKLSMSNCPWITRNNMIMRLPVSIKELDLSNCGIDQHDITQICQRLPNLERLNISRNGGITSRRVIELLSSCPRLTSIDVSFCFAVDIQELVGSRTARDILTRKTGFELHIEGCNWTKEPMVAFSIVYATVQLYAGNNIYVQSAKEFLARINFANIAM